QFEPGHPAFLEMELRRDYVVLGDRGREGNAIIAGRDRQRGIGGKRGVGGDEVEVSIVRDLGESAMGASLTNGFPADLRHLQRSAIDRRWIAPDFACDYPEA